jgi:hypothetical protein
MSDPTKFLTTCSKHCEARSYQVTVRQQAAKIVELELQLKQTLENAMSQASVLHERTTELQARMSAIHAIALALPKLDWESREQFLLFENFNLAVKSIQELSK